MTDIGANRTDLIGDPSRAPGAPARDTQGQGVVRQEAAVGLPTPGRPDVFGPSTRPNEPVTAGLPIGAGPSARPLPGRGDSVLAELEGLVLASGDPQLAILVARLQRELLQ
jgi:hypothetical protein